jgi:hypothetical protein
MKKYTSTRTWQTNFTICISEWCTAWKISLHPYTTITDVGQKDLDIQYITLHIWLCFKTANDDLGFTQNNFWAKCILQNPTDAIYIYLETALPITDLAELYIIDQVSGKISKR